MVPANDPPVFLPKFLQGAGALGELVAATDWGATALGPLDGWPGALRNIVAMMLRSPVAMVTLWGADGILIYNEGYAAIADARHPRIMGMSAAEAFPEIADFNRHVMATVLAGGSLSFKEQPLSWTRDGELHDHWLNLDYSPILDDGGEVAGIIAVVVDSTGKVRAERKLRESEARFRVWAQAMPNQVWSADAGGRLNWFNEQVYGYSGARHGALDGDGWAAIVHDDDLDAALRRWERAVAAGATYETEFRIRRHDGAYRWHLIRALPIRDPAGAAHSWIGTNTDIEDQKTNAVRLQHLNATLAEQVGMRTAERDRMWRLSNEIMLVSDFNAAIVAVNPAFGALLGWLHEDVAGNSFMDLVHPDDLAATLAQVSSLSTGETTFRFENRYRRKDGSYAALSWSAVPDAGYIHAVARDVSAERANAEAMRQAENALRQAQKMDAIGKLTGGVAHDFNNLLQVISGNLQMLAMVPLGHPRAAHWVGNAIGGVQRGAKLASSLLAFGRRQALEPRVVRIGRVVAGMEHMLRHALGEAIDIEIVISGGLWNTQVDVTQVETALLNLAINARDAMNGHGKLTIEAGNAWLDEMYCRQHPEVSPGQYVTLAVSDTGCGMPPEVVAHAFEPFFSTKPEGKGTGLGLSMVYGFVKQSGGHVKIYSEVGQGTAVKLYLPRCLDAEAPLEEPAAPDAAGGRETILVAEDDEGVRAIVVEMLTGLGYRVLKAGDATAALSILESGAPVDLLFTDVVMPGPLRSPDLARRARALLPALAVLFTSGYTENAIVHGGRLDPGVELLGKPYSREALARKVRQVLDRGRPADPQSTPARPSAG